MIPENKLGLTTKEALTDAEERVGKFRAIELLDSGALSSIPVGTFDGLKRIHARLFGDIYASAGELRTVSTARGNLRFTPVESLDTAIRFVNIMPQATAEDVVDKFLEMNIIHPFTKLNGPALRIWLNEMMYAAVGNVIDYSRITPEAYSDAVDKSMSDKKVFYRLAQGALTVDAGRTSYVRNIDASFAFDGYSAYKAQFLRKR